MADQRISELTELAVAPADDDYLVILDTDAATTKKVSVSTAIEKWTFLTTPLTSSSWLLSSGGRSNTSPTLIDLSSVFGVPAGVKAVLIRLVVRDSGAFPQDEKYVSFGPSSTYYYALSCYALGGDYQSSDNGIVPCDSNGDIYYRVVASGTGTMDVNLEIWGYWL